MTTLGRLYTRSDEWLTNLSQGRYAVFLGLAGGVGVIITGLLITRDLLVLQALTLALVMLGLEYRFGLHQPSDE